MNLLWDIWSVLVFLLRPRPPAPSAWSSASWSSTGRVQRPGVDCWSSSSYRSKTSQSGHLPPPSPRRPSAQTQQVCWVEEICCCEVTWSLQKTDRFIFRWKPRLGGVGAAAWAGRSAASTVSGSAKWEGCYRLFKTFFYHTPGVKFLFDRATVRFSQT